MSENTTITTTYVKVTAESDLAAFAGDFDGDMLKEMLLNAYPFLANSVFTEREGDEPGTKVITFSEALGTKGLFL